MTESPKKIWLPYGRQSVDDDDIEAVVRVLRSDWLTTGPKVEQFEEAFAEYVGTNHAVAVSSGTAALHAAIYALGIGPGDEVIVPTLTFAATANSIVFQGGTPVFADVDEETLLIDPQSVEANITSRTKAVVAVDYAGQPCDYDVLETICRKHDLALVDDACHALGGKYKDRAVGSLADLSTFSLHPVKHITAGEGGVITTDNYEYSRKMRIFRNHGISTDHKERERCGSWFYEMVDLGFNYRITDFQCALATSQLKKLDSWVKRRQEIAAYYDKAFNEIPDCEPLETKPWNAHAYHLYVIRLNSEHSQDLRGSVFKALRDRGIGANVHYMPVHLHPFYTERFGTGPGLCPVAEDAYQSIISLPIYPAMTNRDAEAVVESLKSSIYEASL